MLISPRRFSSQFCAVPDRNEVFWVKAAFRISLLYPNNTQLKQIPRQLQVVPHHSTHHSWLLGVSVHSLLQSTSSWLTDTFHHIEQDLLSIICWMSVGSIYRISIRLNANNPIIILRTVIWISMCKTTRSLVSRISHKKLNARVVEFSLLVPDSLTQRLLTCGIFLLLNMSYNWFLEFL